MANKRNLTLRLLMVLFPLIVVSLLVNKQIVQIQGCSYGDKKLLINEVMTDNISVWKNEKGIYADWIEIYNPSLEAIELKEYYLSDDKDELAKWNFPDVVLEPDGYLTLFCDNDINADNKYIHTNFMLNSDKETIYLSDSAGVVVDELRLENQKANVSYGRIYKKADETGFLPYSTVGYANPASFWQHDEEYFQGGELIFNLRGGVYGETIYVTLECEDTDTAILYTLDGSEPDIASYIYNNPIEITDEGRPNQYTTKKCVTNISNADVAYGVNEVYKGTVIRARLLKDGKLSSDIWTNTYFIDADYSFPIVSLTAEPDKLFDEREGNYVLGSGYYTARKFSLNSKAMANHRVSRDIDGHIEIFENNERTFCDDISFSLAGSSSLSSNLLKSFGIKLKNKKIGGGVFGASSKYKYNQFMLRGSGGAGVSDNLYAYPSSFITNYLSKLDIGAQTSRFCILFIDGEYWGIYTLMEPKGKEYIEQHYGVDKKDISLVLPYEYNTTQEFDELFEQISERSFDSAEDYEWIKTKINIDNYMQFVIAEAYFGNADGLRAGDHNFYIWKAKDGLWNWQAYDFDATLVDGENYFEAMLKLEIDGAEENKKNFSVWLFRKLWNCHEFRADFAEMTALLCGKFFVTENVMEAFDAHIQKLSYEMEENLKRCEMDYSPYKKLSYRVRNIITEFDNYTLDDWENTVYDMRRYISDRTETILRYLAEVL